MSGRPQSPRPQIGGIRETFAPWADPQARPLVRFDGVSKTFGDTTAVDDVSVSIYEREFFALLGPSGCGKTTLMRMLAGFEQPDAGRILLADRDIQADPPHRRPVHMMFQAYALFPHLSVAQNIAFGLKQQKMARDEIAPRVEEMLSLVRLDGMGKRRIDQLSGGQRQRVALARALAPRPRILLLDEPMAALDKKLREETQFELMALQQTLGMTFMIVTHDQDEAMVVADRIAVMREGRIVQVGRPAEVYEAPADRYVAGFIGDINLFEGRVAASENGVVRLVSGDGTFEAEGTGPVGETAWVAVRPEKIAVHAEPPQQGVNTLAGRILDYGYLGDWTTYLVEIAPGRTLRAARANATRATDRPLGCDDPVWLTFATSSAVVLTR
ncbi:ABC transporter ATP-binding protein [Phenylobacterium sp.]|uniref:ABC transporter ATP-binding protein n=1 Tax=Phenylobacterium sp. TaxID=1871053 RepID=UPI003451318C